MMGMCEELISIVIPVYNVEQYIGKCIESVQNQTYKNLQIILVDDGSTDNSGHICDDYAMKDKRILCLHKPNGGLSDARNYALDKVKGNYIAFIDSDDYVSRYYIERLYQNILDTQADVSIANFMRVRSTDQITDILKTDRNLRIFNREESFYALYEDDLKYQFTTAWGKLYKTNIFDNIQYPKGRNYEDTSIAHLIYDNVSKVVYEDVNLYYYLVRDSSITKSEQYIRDDIILAVKDRMDFFDKKLSYEDLKIKSREQYFTTLMGVYARMQSDVVNISERKRKIYMQVRSAYKKYKRELSNWKIKTRIKLFLLSPGIYSKILTKLK